MKFVLKRYLLVIASLFILTQLIPAIKIDDSWKGLFYASLILAILFYIIKPVLNIVMLPINLVTLNLSAWIFQIAIFYLWTIIVNVIKISVWQFPGTNLGPITLSAFNLVKWQVILAGAVIYIVINKLLGWIFK